MPLDIDTNLRTQILSCDNPACPKPDQIAYITFGVPLPDGWSMFQRRGSPLIRVACSPACREAVERPTLSGRSKAHD